MNVVYWGYLDEVNSNFTEPIAVGVRQLLWGDGALENVNRRNRRFVELLSIVVFYESGLGGGFLLEEAVFEGTSFDDVEDLLVAS